MQDGAHPSARAVLCILQGMGNIEESWNDKSKRYTAEIKVARWENCREQGYILSLSSESYEKQLNIAFFEHRNSDNICGIKWEQRSLNSLNIDTMNTEGTVYKDKYDVSHSVGYDKHYEMAEWIMEQFHVFWVSNRKTQEKV